MLSAPRYLFGQEARCHRGRDGVNHSEAGDRLGQGEAGNNFRGTQMEGGLRFVRAPLYISWGQASAFCYWRCLLIRWRSLKERA